MTGWETKKIQVSKIIFFYHKNDNDKFACVIKSSWINVQLPFNYH